MPEEELTVTEIQKTLAESKMDKVCLFAFNELAIFVDWFAESKEMCTHYLNNILLLITNLKRAFKASGPKWHDLRKDPTDVPKENVTVLLLTEVGPVTARYDNEYEAFFRLSDKLNYCVFIAPMSYIAWCELPKFEETDK